MKIGKYGEKVKKILKFWENYVIKIIYNIQYDTYMKIILKKGVNK